MTFSIDLTEEPGTFLVTMFSGRTHRTSLDTCDCEATRYGRLCIHRSLIFAMGGTETLTKHIRTETRKHQLNSQAKETNRNEDQRSISDQVPIRRGGHP